MRTLLLLVVFAPTLLFAQPYWQQDVHYTIDAALDPNANTIIGKERLVYKNNSPDTLGVVYFHLYWNLFTKGSYGQQYEARVKNYYSDTTGGITIRKFAIADAGTETPLTYSIDNTLMRADLPKPLLPGERTTFVFEFTERITESGARTGHKGRDYNIAQWYPQIATYDDKIGWDKSQYLGTAEFYLEYGTFDVTLSVPKSFTLGYTGVLLNPESVYTDSIRERLKSSEGKSETVRIANYSSTQWSPADTALITWKFHADSVRDFAWSANEHYIWDVAHWFPTGGSRGITCHALYFADKEEYWKNAAEWTRHTISFASEHFGMYAYPNVFVVEGVVGGGMEYPGITFIGHYGEDATHSPFGIITHEVGHNWFPMMIGSNETYYAFMDEGFTTYLTARATEDYFGRYSNAYSWTKWYSKLLCFPNDDERSRIQRSYFDLAMTGYEEPIATHSYRFTEPGLAGISIYPKTGSVLYMLQYVLGDSTFEYAMKEYYNRWKFKHPYPEDFYATIEKVSGQHLRWFWEEWFNSTVTLDYGISGFSSDRIRQGDQTLYRTTVKVHRYRPAIMPVDVQIDCADGTHRTIWFPIDKWLNAEVEHDTTIDLPAEPVKAELNPDGRLLDINRLNNSSSLPKFAVRFDNTIVDVAPIDAYLVKWRPSLWYTDIGGVNVGFKVSGSYLGDERVRSLWTAYNTRDNTLNYDLNFSENLSALAPLSTTAVRWYRIEGRKGVALSFEKGFRRHFSYPPFHTLRLGYSYSQADNNEYLLHPDTWQEGILHRVLLGYRYFNRGKFWNVSASANLELSTSLLGWNDFLYTKRTFDIRTRLNVPLGFDVSLRYFDGVGYGDIPNQTKYYIASASPIETIDDPLLRSKGPLPSTVRDHAVLPGGGFVRGFFMLDPFGDKLDAFNAELKFQSFIPFFDLDLPILNQITRRFHSILFADAGRIASQSEKLWDKRFEGDAGFGFELTSLYSVLDEAARSNLLSSVGLHTIRVDFPIYLTISPLNEDRLKFRWLLTFSEIL